jgi:hypothetical protein
VRSGQPPKAGVNYLGVSVGDMDEDAAPGVERSAALEAAHGAAVGGRRDVGQMIEPVEAGLALAVKGPLEGLRDHGNHPRPFPVDAAGSVNL